MPNGIGSSEPTSVAETPGCAAARLASMLRMRAWGWGERSSRANNMRGRTRSSAKSVWPDTFAWASTLGRFCPMTLNWCFSAATHDLDVHRGRTELLSTHLRRRALDRFEDLDVARAAAEVPGGGLGDLLPRGARVAPQQRVRGQEETRNAVAALGRAELRERVLQGVEGALAGHALDRRDLAALAFDRQREARQDGQAADEDGAGAALAQLAAVFGAHEAEVLAEHLQQRVVDGGQDLAVLPVHPQP
jgi:hypothetical protein